MAPGDARSVTVLASFRIRPGTNRADFVIGEPEMLPLLLLFLSRQISLTVLAPIVPAREAGALTYHQPGEVGHVVIMAPALDNVQDLGYVVERVQPPESVSHIAVLLDRDGA